MTNVLAAGGAGYVRSYYVVFDTLIDDMPAEMISDRPWALGITQNHCACVSRDPPGARNR